MKKLYALLLVLWLFIPSASAQTEGDFAYSVTDGKATITAYAGSAAELILPDTLGGYPVEAIGVCAFRNASLLTRVVIPEGITTICSNAFLRCTSLEQLLIPASVVRIDTHAFYACAALKQIVLHDNLNCIDSLAFYGCSAVRLCSPDSLTAYTLTDVGYSFTSPDYPQLSLMTYERDAAARTFTVTDCDESAVSVSFPDGVTAIDNYAFFGCAALSEIVLPDGVKEIGLSAFEGCRTLAQITLPGSVEKIAENAFFGCGNVVMIAPPGSAGQTFAEENAANGFAWKPM